MSATRRIALAVSAMVPLAFSGERDGAGMIFFCYIYSLGSEVPHMEALTCASLSEAQTRCRRMLNDHRAAVRAELFDDDQRVAIISRDEAGDRQAQA